MTFSFSIVTLSEMQHFDSAPLIPAYCRLKTIGTSSPTQPQLKDSKLL